MLTQSGGNWALIGIFTVISSMCTAAPSLLQNWKNRVVQLKRSSIALLEQTEKATIPHPLLSLKQLKLPDFHVDAAFDGAKKIVFKQNYQTYNMITWCPHELDANVLIKKRMPRIVKKCALTLLAPISIFKFSRLSSLPFLKD